MAGRTDGPSCPSSCAIRWNRICSGAAIQGNVDVAVRRWTGRDRLSDVNVIGTGEASARTKAGPHWRGWIAVHDGLEETSSDSDSSSVTDVRKRVCPREGRPADGFSPMDMAWVMSQVMR